MKKARKLRLVRETLQRADGRLARVIGASDPIACVTNIELSYCTCGYSCGPTCFGSCDLACSAGCSDTCITCGGRTCGYPCEDWI